MTISEIFSKTDRSGTYGLASRLCMSSAILIVLGSTAHAATADLDAVMARLEKLEADNKRIVSENADLKQRLHRLEGSKQANSNNSTVPQQVKYITSTSPKNQLLDKNFDAFPVIPTTNSTTVEENIKSKWSGFYGGLNAGYGWGTSNTSSTSTMPISDSLYYVPNWSPYWGPGANYTVSILSQQLGATSSATTGTSKLYQSGIVGGLQGGYNFVLPYNFLVGLETDIQGSSVSGNGKFSNVVGQSLSTSQSVNNVFSYSYSSSTNYLGTNTTEAGIRWIGTTRARVGWLPVTSLLIYGTGGLAYGNVYANSSNSFIGVGNYLVNTSTPNTYYGPLSFSSAGGAGYYSSNKVGWSAGGGAEWIFMPNWSLKAEAIYYSLGSSSFTSSPVGVVGVNANLPTTHVHYNGIVGRAGVNYHFNMNNLPVAAKL